MAPSISVHEGDSYDPNGPTPELDRKVAVVTDEQTEEMSEEEAAKTRQGVDPEVLEGAQKDFEEGKGPRVVDLRSDDQKPSEGDEDEEGKEDEPSPGTSSSTSSAPGGKSTKQTSYDNAATVPSAVGPSKEDNAESGTAPQGTGKKALKRNN
jgi:hypothetical protein